MTDITNDEPNRYLTTEEAFELFKRLQIEDRQQRESNVHGSELPLDISETLNGTPLYDLKEECKRFKRHVAKYNNAQWNGQEQLNKELIPELKRWKVDTFQVVTQIYKYSDNTRVQARGSTEIYEQLRYLQDKIQFNSDDDDKQIFEGALDQAAKLAIFGFAQAKFQDHDAKDFATKALRLPASLKHLEKSEEDRVTNTFDTEFIATLHQARFQQRLLNGNTHQQQYSGRPFGRVDIFNREEGGVGATSPHQQQTPLPQRPINSCNSSTNSSVDTNKSSLITPNNTTNTATTAAVSTSITTTSTTTSTTTTTDSSKLLNTTGWNPSRRPSSSFLTQLATDRPTSVATEDYQRRLPNSVCSDTKSLALTKNHNNKRRARRNQHCRKQVSYSRNHRSMPQPTITRFPIQVFHTTGSNEETSNSGLPPNQSMYPGGTFQDERHPSVKRFDRARRLYGQTGFAGRVHRNTYPSRIKTFLSVQKRRHHLPIQIAKFRIKCSPKNFFQNTALCHRTVKKTGDPFGILLGRHLSAIKGRKRFGANNKDGNTPSRVLRIRDKPEEKHADSIPCTGISGVSIQHHNHEDQCARTEGQEAHTKD